MHQDLENSLRRYLSGNATNDEKKQVEDYYASFSNADSYASHLSDQDRKALEEKILKNIYRDIHVESETFTRTVRMRPLSVYLKVAAAIAGLLVLAAGSLLFSGDDTVRIATGYGEVITHILPDSSTVVLNGNSVLEYSSWGSDEDRSVTLSGEGFFSVTHTRNHRKFVVHVPGQYAVEVLGTEFDISQRSQRSRVVLKSGKIRLTAEGLVTAPIIMKPGDMAVKKTGEREFATSTVNTALYSSWKDRKLLFDDTPLEEIVSILKENYGYTVIISDRKLLTETFTGTIPGNDVEMLLIGLSRSFDVEVDKSRKHIEIRE